MKHIYYYNLITVIIGSIVCHNVIMIVLNHRFALLQSRLMDRLPAVCAFLSLSLIRLKSRILRGHPEKNSTSSGCAIPFLLGSMIICCNHFQ